MWYKRNKSILHADKIHNMTDVTKYLMIYDEYGKPRVHNVFGLDGKKGYSNRYTWKAENGRKTTALDHTKYYPSVEKLILANSKLSRGIIMKNQLLGSQAEVSAVLNYLIYSKALDNPQNILDTTSLYDSFYDKQVISVVK